MNKPLKAVAGIVAASVLGSCAHFSGELAENRSWRDSGTEPILNVALARPRVECRTGGASIEDEIERLAPLLLRDRKIAVTTPEPATGYIVRIAAVERDIQNGWKTKRSISIDLSLHRYGNPEDSGSVPLAASRIVASGSSASLSSSSYLSSALSEGIRLLSAEMIRARRKLPR